MSYVGGRSTLMAVALLAPAAWSMDCGSPSLKSASGVIGKEHSYKIAGTCTHAWSKTETSWGSSSTTNYGLTFVYSGGATWNRATGVAIEKLGFKGDSTGARHATATCTQDPFLTNAPGGAVSCGPVSVQLEIAAGKPYEVLTQKTFWAYRKLSLVEAQALSAQSSTKPPPPPPPPPEPKPDVPVVSAAGAAPGVAVAEPPVAPAGRALARPATPARTAVQPVLLEIEAEALVKSNAFQVTGGQARVQPMGGFGGAWSGGEQLFWSGGAAGAVLDLLIDIPAGSKYAVEAYFTRAPDYAQLKIEVDGKPSPVTFDGMAPTVAQTGPTQVGNFPLPAGQRRISLMIVGKHPQSSGYYVGIDRIRLYPAGPLN